MAVSKESSRQRYYRILTPMTAQPSFTFSAIQESCDGVSPRMLTMVIRQLSDEGWLVEEPPEEAAQGGESGGNGRLRDARLRWREQGPPFSIDGWIDTQLRGTQLTQTPKDERPRERLMQYGAATLRTAELLAILIRTGRKGESALQSGERIANRFSDSLHALPAMGLAELKQVSSAVSEPAYCQIIAGIELGRRVANSIDESMEHNVRFDCAEAAIQYCQHRFARIASDARQEEFHIVTADTKHQPIATHRITVGTLDASLVHPREVFRPAIRDAAAAILLVHNHPSGDPTPSPEDRQVTRQLERAAETVGISVLDHIIIAGKRAISLRQWEAG